MSTASLDVVAAPDRAFAPLAFLFLALLPPVKKLLPTTSAQHNLNECALLLAVFRVRERHLELGQRRWDERFRRFRVRVLDRKSVV